MSTERHELKKRTRKEGKIGRGGWFISVKNLVELALNKVKD
jgi:hypothetical protein